MHQYYQHKFRKKWKSLSIRLIIWPVPKNVRVWNIAHLGVPGEDEDECAVPQDTDNKNEREQHRNKVSFRAVLVGLDALRKARGVHIAGGGVGAGSVQAGGRRRADGHGRHRRVHQEASQRQVAHIHRIHTGGTTNMH